MPTVTVNGANGQTFAVQYNSTDAVSSAQALASTINAVVASPGVSTQVLTAAGAVTAPGAGKYGQLVLTNTSGVPFQVSSGADQIIVANGNTPVSVAGAGLSNVSVISGAGGLTFNTGAQPVAGNPTALANPTGVVIVAGGTNVIGTTTNAGGSMFVRLGAGNDSVVAIRGQNTIVAGLGANLISTGTANDLIYTEGADIIVGDTLPGGGGADTIGAVGGGSDFVYGGSSNVTFLSSSTSASTVLGGTGTDTLFAGSAGGQFYAGTGGNSTLVGGSGPTTLVGGASGDQLFAVYTAGSGPTTAGSSYLVAGAGNETIDGAFDSRGVQAFAGNNTTINGAAVTANTVVYGGSGNDTLYAGTGNATLNGFGGSDVFAFINGSAGGSDQFSGFTSSSVIQQIGYGSVNGASAQAAALASASVTGGSTVITLSDNTKITLSGFTGQLGSSNFT